MKKAFLIILFLPHLLFSITLEDKISNLFLIGFEGKRVPSKLCSYLKVHPLGGVILFSKNISSPWQLKRLTTHLQTCSKYPLFIAIDEEGGAVQRLSSKNGFFDTPSAKKIASMKEKSARYYYHKMAKILKEEGINLNLAPSVDLSINPKNRVIVKRGRSFGKSPKIVEKYASIFIKEMKKEGVIACLKHFPGHGSSLGDSHKGFVDVSRLWKKRELEPFLNLKADMIMSAHIFNSHLDPLYPATLSKKTLSILRKNGFAGLIISDDMQMRAISSNYSQKKALALALNAGVDILLIGNQLSKPQSIYDLVREVKELVSANLVSKERINEANDKILRLKSLLR